MPKIRITKHFDFEMAHALWNYNGKCKNIHGHSYNLYVTVIGDVITNLKDPKVGMVIDFGDLKKAVKQTIVDRFDHAVVFNSKAPTKNFINTEQMFDRKEIFDFQPTAELLVTEFAALLKPLLPENVELFSLRLYETADSYAEWFASDNK